MCHFVTLIVPSADTDAVRAVMKRHGRTAVPLNNASVAKVLRDDERQYMTSMAICECGTVLAAPAKAVDETQDTARLKRKGWSEAKIARALAEKRKASARPVASQVDSLAMWAAAITDLRTSLSLTRVGLLVHFYSGGLDSDVFTVDRVEISTSDLTQSLSTMAEDAVTLFRAA